ncbi:MAG: flippase-like domain-containing protein [Nitrospirota bacterium]|nr:flippase-like domain-containing protein [Nitrospirota bacterium]
MALASNKTVVFFLKLAVSSLALYVVFSKADEGQILSILKSIGVFYFFSSVLLYISAQLVSSYRWKLLLPEKFTVRRLFSIYMIGAFFGSFMPGIIGGDAVRAYYLNKKAKKMSLTLASIFMDRYFGYVSLMLIGISAAPFALRYFGDSPYRWLMPFIFAAFITGSILFFGLQIGKKFRGVSEFYEYFIMLKTQKGTMIKAVLISFLVQFLNFGIVVVLAAGMGEKIPLLLLFVFLPIVITITTIPVSISGLGVREGTFVILLGLIGVRPEIATSLSLAYFFSVFAGSVPGLAFYFALTKKTDRTGA